MACLSKSDILSRAIPRETIDVPEWGGTVAVRGLTAKERDDLGYLWTDEKGREKPGWRAAACCMAIVDEAGKPVFSSADFALLGDKHTAAVGRVWEVIARLSGIGDEAFTLASKRLAASLSRRIAVQIARATGRAIDEVLETIPASDITEHIAEMMLAPIGEPEEKVETIDNYLAAKGNA